MKFIVRFFRDDVDDAAKAVPSVQRPLRPAQHFDPLNVEQVGVEHAGVHIVHVVHIKADGRIVVDGPDAAYEGVRVAPEPPIGDEQVRNLPGDILNRADARVLDLLFGNGGHADRHVLHVLRALFGRDQHGIEFIGFLRPSGQRPRRQQNRRKDTRYAVSLHAFPSLFNSSFMKCLTFPASSSGCVLISMCAPSVRSRRSASVISAKS